ncbi:hypothetical protein L9F63_013446, partial [Diploptera punctata]
ALNGFLLILTCEGEVFFATHSIESYLGFHQVNLAKCVTNINGIYIEVQVMIVAASI